MKLNTNKMFKVNNRNTRTRCEICSKLTIKIPERRHWQVDAGWNTTKTGDLHINSLSDKLLGITFDCKWKFNKHIKDICQNASQKLNALARLAPCMGTTKKCILMNAIFKSQFNYCILVWICCNRSLNT